jgi:hypothetical protein
MASYNKTCLISGTQIKKNEKVNVFFLASTGSYKNNKTIMVGDMVYPWNAFKVIAGVSVEAINKGYGRFEIIKNRRSELVLNYIKELSKIEEIGFDSLFKLMSEGKVKLDGVNENIYLSACFISGEVYNQMIEIGKSKFDSYILNDFKRYNKEVQKINEDEKMSNIIKDDIIVPEIGYLQQYMYGRKNPYAYIKNKIEQNYNENKFFEDFHQDLIIVEIMKETGVLFSPTMLLNEDIGNDLKSEILKISLMRSLKQDDNEEYLSVKHEINIIQKLTMNELEEFFSEIEDQDSEIYQSFLKFKNETNQSIMIEKENIGSYLFLSYFLKDENKDTLIVF